MSVIIDIQGLKDKCNNFLPKEVAIVSLTDDYIGYWLVKPPCAYADLPPNIKRQNAWLKIHCHGIAWSEGDTSLEAIEQILKKTAEQADRIFTRGSVKSTYLTNLTGCFVVNLEEEDNEHPTSFKRLDSGRGTRCIYHSLLHTRPSYNCSLDYATRIKEWLCHSDRFDHLWEYRTVGSIAQNEPKKVDKKCFAAATAADDCFERGCDEIG